MTQTGKHGHNNLAPNVDIKQSLPSLKSNPWETRAAFANEGDRHTLCSAVKSCHLNKVNPKLRHYKVKYVNTVK